jgi:small subunit ribosomal protein S21
VEVKRKPGESFESLFRRFKERLQKARVLEQAKKTFFREKALSERKKREAALRREEARKRREYLRRIGKLEESE